MRMKLVERGGQDPETCLPANQSPSTTQIRETILLDLRVQDLRVPLVEAGFEVRLIPLHQRGTIPLRRPGMAPRPPILITGKVSDWLEKDTNPMTLGVSLVNVAAIVDHPEGCATLLLRALRDPNVPAYDLFWMDFSAPDGRRHLMLFVRE